MDLILSIPVKKSNGFYIKFYVNSKILAVFIVCGVVWGWEYF